MKYLSIKYLFLLIAITYFLTRLINLTIIPIFVDEAIYTHWSQIIGSDKNYFFIPLSDGKQPLFMWIGSISLKIFSDPLFGERFVSVLAGFGSIIALYFLCKELFDEKTAFISSLLYLLCPFSMMYDRLAVPDNLLTTFFVLIALSMLYLMKKTSLRSSVMLGFFFGGGMLTKSTAAITLFTMPFTLIFFKWQKSRLLRSIYLAALALVIGFLLYYILKISPLFYLIKQRTPDFIFTPQEILKHPLDPFVFRIPEVATWLLQYLSIGLFLVCLTGLGLLIFKDWKRALFVSAWFFGPLLIEMEIAKGFTPRYFIFVTPFALIFGSFLISEFLKFSRWMVYIFLLFLIPAVIFEYQLLTNPESAPIPQKEKTGYLEDWSAGYGILEISDFLRNQAKSGQAITVGTEGTQGYGVLPDGLQVYLRDVKNITVVGMGQRADIYSVPENLISDSKIHPAYLVVNESRFYDKKSVHLNLIKSYPKANGQNPLSLYQIKN